MKKYLLLLGIIAIFAFIATLQNIYFMIKPVLMSSRMIDLSAQRIKSSALDKDTELLQNEGMKLLRFRYDQEALLQFEQILSKSPDNIDALWGKAEVLRRSRFYKQSESILVDLLKNSPLHVPSLISMANIRFKEENFDQAIKLIDQVLVVSRGNKDDQALAYVLLSGIESRNLLNSWLVTKIKYGTKIKNNLMKAKLLSPDLPEVSLAMGTFYFYAPSIMGGGLDKAIQELESAVKIAPCFATVNARLAQSYKKKGDLEKFKLYFAKAKKLDPDNEVLKEIND